MNANNYINHDIKDIDAKTAKANYYAYQDSLRQLQQGLKNGVIKLIRLR